MAAAIRLVQQMFFVALTLIVLPSKCVSCMCDISDDQYSQVAQIVDCENIKCIVIFCIIFSPSFSISSRLWIFYFFLFLLLSFFFSFSCCNVCMRLCDKCKFVCSGHAYNRNRGDTMWNADEKEQKQPTKLSKMHINFRFGQSRIWQKALLCWQTHFKLS